MAGEAITNKYKSTRVRYSKRVAFGLVKKAVTVQYGKHVRVQDKT